MIKRLLTGYRDSTDNIDEESSDSISALIQLC